MTVIEIRPYRNGWQVYESPSVQPVFLNQGDAIDYATGRAWTPPRLAAPPPVSDLQASLLQRRRAYDPERASRHVPLRLALGYWRCLHSQRVEVV